MGSRDAIASKNKDTEFIFHLILQLLNFSARYSGTMKNLPLFVQY